MRTAHYTKYGPPEVFSIIESPRPKPKDNEILVKVICTTVNRTDTGMTSANYFVSRIITGLFKPKKTTPGTDFAGIVAEVGKGVSKFKEGDEVFGFDDNILSSQAEYMLISESSKIDLKPKNISFEEATASIEGAHYAINMMEAISLKDGDRILVNGATGAIGSATVQLLKSEKAKLHITAVADTANLELVKNLGADRVIDYLKEDFTKENTTYSYVLDSVGKSSFKKCKPLLQKKGIYISSELGKNGANIWQALLAPFKSGPKVLFPIPKDIPRSIKKMRHLLESGKFKPVIDRSYPLAEIREAYKYVVSGMKTGNVILAIQLP